MIELLDTRSFFELLALPYPSDRNAVMDRLVAEQLINCVDGSFVVRRMGALLLANRLRDFDEALARRAPRVIVYRGTSKFDTRIDQVEDRGLAVGFQRLVQFVVEQLPQNEVVEDALRRSVKLAPEIVIRELVANALVHQELEIGGMSPTVEIYDDRVEVSNPGAPMVPVERFIDGYQSRYERLADLMRRMRICEEKSSGIDKVVRAAEMYQLPAPDFRNGFQRTSVVVFGPREFEGMTRDDRVRACYQHCCLRYVMNDHMTNQSLRERFHLPESKSSTISQIISATIESRMIKLDKAVGTSRRFARYLPVWA